MKCAQPSWTKPSTVRLGFEVADDDDSQDAPNDDVEDADTKPAGKAIDKP